MPRKTAMITLLCVCGGEATIELLGMSHLEDAFSTTLLVVSQMFLLSSTSLHNSHGWNWLFGRGGDTSAGCLIFGPLDFDSKGISVCSGLDLKEIDGFLLLIGKRVISYYP